MMFRKKQIGTMGLAMMLLPWILTVTLSPSHAREATFRNSVGMDFVLIRPGTFLMGSPNKEPHRDRDEAQHQVHITRAFYMQTTEVTNRQWNRVMGSKWFGGGGKGRAMSLPKVKVSWFDCIQFLKKLNALAEGVYRLPSEAEWEYACRSGSPDAYSWGGAIDCTRAMYSNNSLKSEECKAYAQSKGFRPDGPAPVGSYPPNPWGLYDMHGNVWEWCESWYGPYPKDPQTDPRGPEMGRIKTRRGGSWFKDGWLCRSANRNFGHPSSRYRTLGFRVVREAP